ncbi:helix-turn-helix domain-containing protein [Nocardioides sp. cx-169]|uniref:helix-turn-helix domain-containing protein n=1 Tax=Nocardioides sp. cx-169 TaxID=2899080 RepID=UPI001E3E08FB|nr:helix-turn-helix domain-containing protein [Nocardioides sp. cx-169]MCD4534600.1 helix-turn-helix domain-containing protein [Nocardioides sp. cx-169]
MAVLLDTAALARRDRYEAFRAAMAEASGATCVELETGTHGVVGRMELAELGEARVFTARSTGITMHRAERTARAASPEAVAIAVHGDGVGRLQLGERRRLVHTGDLMVVDVTRPFDFAWSGWGSSVSLQVPIARLGLPLEVVQRASSRLPSSPLHGIVSRYLVELTRDAERLSASTAAPQLGEASTQLVRALLSGAADDGSRDPEVLDQTLATQIRAYVHQHLRDPGLDADQVAGALAVSRRQLFRACAGAGFSLEQHVIAQRLAGARSELASAPVHRPISQVARSWGFKDTTHFIRRFRAAYGVLPRDWRAQALAEAR